MNLLGMGPLEVIVIGIVAMLIMGPERIGHTFKSIAELSKQLRNQSKDLNDAITKFARDPIEQSIEIESEENITPLPDSQSRPKSNINIDSNEDKN
jgi:Sec-independent protein translocase protein TatA